MSAQSGPKELKQLRLVSGCQEASDLWSSVLLSWLAACAQGLCTLSLDMCKLRALPPLPGLKHLILDQDCMDLPALVRNLPILTGLQTLWLGFSSLEQDNGHVELALDSLCQLRHVHLNGMVPSKLLLPPDATLHVTVYSAWAAHHPVWHSVLQTLRNFVWEESHSDLVEVPEVLRQPSSLINVTLNMRRLGSNWSQPLHVHKVFSPSVSVHITCQDAWVDVWGGTWRLLSMVVANRLVLSNSHSTPVQCSDFRFEYTLLEGACASAVTACGKRQVLSNGRECLSMGLGQCLPLDSVLRTCGACESCLKESGELSAPCFDSTALFTCL
jgi:hypothetical protein